MLSLVRRQRTCLKEMEALYRRERLAALRRMRRLKRRIAHLEHRLSQIMSEPSSHTAPDPDRSGEDAATQTIWEPEPDGREVSSSDQQTPTQLTLRPISDLLDEDQLTQSLSGVEFLSSENRVKVCVKSKLHQHGSRSFYATGIWFAPSNTFNQVKCVETTNLEYSPTKFELDLKAVACALALAKELNVERILVVTDSSYLPRVSVEWMTKNCADGWRSMAGLVSDIQLLDWLYKIFLTFSDVEIIKVSKDSLELREITAEIDHQLGMFMLD